MRTRHIRRLIGATPIRNGVVGMILASGAPAAAAESDARVAALEAQVQALMAQMEALQGQMAAQATAGNAPVRANAVVPVPAGRAGSPDMFPVTIAPSGAPMLQQPPTAGVDGHPFFAPAPEGRRTGILGAGNDRFRLTFSGQINRALNFVDDGNDTDVYHVDNENASTRFRFLGETADFEDWKAVSLFEFEYLSNRSLVVNQTNESGNEQISRRLLDIGLSNNEFGSLFIGHGWMASDGTSELDISGVTTPAWPSVHFGFGGMLFTDRDGLVDRDPAATGLQGVSVFSVMDSLDGLSRRDRVRYNSPVIEGFQLSASTAADDAYDVALRWTGAVPGARVLVGGSHWIDEESRGGFDGFSASGTMRLEGNDAWYDGISLVGAVATQDFDEQPNDPLYWYGKLAYVTDIWNVGRTGFAVNYGSYDEFAAKDEDGHMVGIGLSQNVDPLGLELYAGLHRATLDSPTIDYNDIWVLQTGTMVRF